MGFNEGAQLSSQKTKTKLRKPLRDLFDLQKYMTMELFKSDANQLNKTILSTLTC
jgi:hypothetical protein